jgi:hypothetical protein
MKGKIRMSKTTKPRTQNEIRYAQPWAEIEPPKLLKKKEGILPKWRTKE